jgi:hypothetical protein
MADYGKMPPAGQEAAWPTVQRQYHAEAFDDARGRRPCI